MNERIRELVEQATRINEVHCEGYQGRSYTRQEKYFDKEKFAELIVRECAEVGLDSVEDGDDLDAIMKRVHNNILTHFRVEE